MTRYAIVLCLGVLVLGCDRRSGPSDPSPVSIDQELRATFATWGVLPIGPMPPQDSDVVRLGRALVFDKELSGNRDVSCATCHQPAAHMGDGLPLAVGTGGTGSGTTRLPGAGREFVPRNAPTLLNSGLGFFYEFWDGHVSGFRAGPFQSPAGPALPGGLPNVLAAQAMFPVVNRREMRGDPGDVDVFGNPNELALYPDTAYAEIWRAVMRRLLAMPQYQAMFAAAFPGTPAAQLRFEHAATAIAAFEMAALTTTGSPFDRYLARDDAALTAREKRGAQLFFGDARCVQCHNGPFLGGQSFANAGVPQLGPGVGSAAPLDFGFGEVIDQEFYRFAFRVAPLRNVELTAPYMHNGAFATLEAVLDHYNDVPAALRAYDGAHLPPALRGAVHGDAATIDAVLATLDFRLLPPLGLNEAERQDVVAFLRTLTDPAARDLALLVPASVPSGLPVRD
jgi:cytochrome c peroxidase